MNILTQKKKCNKCGEYKDRGEFQKDKQKPDGLRYECRVCNNLKIKERYLANIDVRREQGREYSRVWRENNLERRREIARNYAGRNRDKYKNNLKLWRDANPEKVKVQRRKQREKDPEKHRERFRRWYRSVSLKVHAAKSMLRYYANPEKYHQYRHNRYARVKGAGGTVTLREWEALKEFYEYTCLRCHRQEPEIQLTRDHIVSLDGGGQNVISNIQPLCRSCNSSKGSKSVDYRQGRLYDFG